MLAANGVAPGRLGLDENGLPDEVLADLTANSAGGSSARSRPDDAPVRFLYAGGPDPMKGADVLVEAVARLGRDCPTGWSLRAYGLAPGTLAAHLPVEVAEPYDPAELGAILADHDVLVLASVMRETALAAHPGGPGRRAGRGLHRHPGPGGGGGRRTER